MPDPVAVPDIEVLHGDRRAAGWLDRSASSVEFYERLGELARATEWRWRANAPQRRAEQRAASDAPRKPPTEPPKPQAPKPYLPQVPDPERNAAAAVMEEPARARTKSRSTTRVPASVRLCGRGCREPIRTRAGASSASRARSKPGSPRLKSTEHPAYRLPSTELLNEVPARNPFDSLELKEIAARIKSKFEEFNVHGAVVQINPGPVVTTFEFKPEAGVKYSRITTLTEDLCLGLQAESILIERIPGKPTVGIEVPNTRREVISLRQILESEEFIDSNSRLTMCLGKDISGRIKVAALESMPHLLIAGSTGAGKSVMLNSMIMSILYKSTPDEVRMILVDPEAPGNGACTKAFRTC